MQVRDDQGDDDDHDEGHRRGHADHRGAPHVGGGEDPACDQQASPQAPEAGEGRRGRGHRHARGEEVPHDHANYPSQDKKQDLDADPPQQVGVLRRGPKLRPSSGHECSSRTSRRRDRMQQPYPTADHRSAHHAISARTCVSRSSGTPTAPGLAQTEARGCRSRCR